jgi:Cof subfamily protein (haloacid dehalogenase superfamily)
MKLENINKKRLILLDLDGTVLRKDGVSIHEKTSSVLKKAVADGHTVCLITGRPNRASIRFYRELGLQTLMTNFDGAHIHDPLRRNFKRFVFPVSEEITNEIINNPIVKKNATNILIESYDKAVVAHRDEFIEKFFHLDDVEGDEYFIADPYKDWTGNSTNIVILVEDDDKKDDTLREMEKFKNTIKIQSGTMYGNLSEHSNSMISLTNKIANKGFVTNILAQYYNKDVRDVIAFGDQMNDYEMIKTVGYGIAMKNGADTLKNNADGITNLTNDEGGVGEYLERLLAGEEV